MSLAHDIWNEEPDRVAEWRSIPKNLKSTNLLLPSVRFTVFAMTAIAAGAVLAFVT